MKLRRLISGLVIFLLISLFSVVFANHHFQSISNSFPDTKIQFDVHSANRTLDKLAIKLSIQNLNATDLGSAAKQLTQLKSQARNCVEDSQDELSRIQKLWKETPAEIKNEAELTSLQKYLKMKKGEYTEQRSECRLFVLRANEAISAFSKTAETLSTRKLLKPEPQFLARLWANFKLTGPVLQNFDSKLFLKNSGLKHFDWLISTIIGLFLLTGFFLGLSIRRSIKQKLPDIPKTNFIGRLQYTLASTTKRYIVMLLFTLAFTISFSVLGLFSKQTTYLMQIGYTSSLYILILMILHFFFYPFHENDSFSGLTTHISQLLLVRIKLLVTLCFVGTIFFILFYQQPLHENIPELARTIFITLLAISLLSILWLINRAPKMLNAHKVLRLITSILLTLLLVAIIAAEWLGYQQLVTFILKAISLTLIYGFIAYVFHKIVVGCLRSLSQAHYSWQKDLREYLNIKPKQNLSELVCLRVLFFILIWGALTLALLKLWGISAIHYQHLISSINDGFKVAGIDIIPTRIISALFFFTIAVLLTRWLRAIIEHHSGEHVNRGSQQALAAFVGYVGFSIVLLFALLIAGVSFAGLAIIAGALSVGIGFGLQNIVNNFVSGIILLVERPIKPGDRIMVGDTEGFVKKISLRSTQIQTLQYSDLIVPNSEIVSRQVTNLMFKDFYGRIAVGVGVIYGSDTELVRKTLLKIAAEHPEVIDEEGAYQPWALFKEFADSSLKFKLYCVIKNVNLKYVVASELRLAIDKAFRELGITIAFPQRDLHIRDWTKKD